MARFFIVACLALTGCGTPSFLITPVTSSDQLQEIVVQPGSGSSKVLVVPIDGMIANARTGMPPFSASENQVALIAQQLDRAARDSSVKAVVLRINSPGGTVTGSDTIYSLVRKFREKTGKPVIASCQEVCASGGYYVACAADVIVAQPTSLVGSIGVIFQTLSFEQLLARWGVVPTTIKSGTMKDIGSPLHDPTPGEKAVMQGMIDEFFIRFRSIVSTRRGLQGDRLATVTDGRVFSGQKAHELGLVDVVGTLEDALDLARQKAKTPKAAAILLRRPYGPGGSIYASSEMPAPQASPPSIELSLPSSLTLPTGFYYLWRP